MVPWSVSPGINFRQDLFNLNETLCHEHVKTGHYGPLFLCHLCKTGFLCKFDSDITIVMIKDKEALIRLLNLEKIIANLTKFIEIKLEIYELKLKEQLADIISSIAILFIILSFGFLVLFFASMALGFYLNSVLDSAFLGFLIMGGFNLLICVLLVMIRDKIITNPLFQAFFSETLIKESDEQDSDREDEDQGEN